MNSQYSVLRHICDNKNIKGKKEKRGNLYRNMRVGYYQQDFTGGWLSGKASACQCRRHVFDAEEQLRQCATAAETVLQSPEAPY